MAFNSYISHHDLKKVLTISIILWALASYGNTEKGFRFLNDSVNEVDIECDTLFSFAIHLIDCCSMTGDSVNIVGTDIYFMELPKKIIGAHFSTQLHHSIDTSNSWRSMGFDTLFTRQNLEDQKLQNNDLIEECYPQFSFIQHDSLKKRIEDSSPDKYPAHYSFSKPLMSNGGKYLLIEMDTHCWGFCGSGETYVFMKKNGNWSLLLKKTRWVS